MTVGWSSFVSEVSYLTLLEGALPIYTIEGRFSAEELVSAKAYEIG